MLEDAKEVDLLGSWLKEVLSLNLLPFFPSEIQAETHYQDLDEWSSLTAMSIIAMAKTQYGKAITGKEIRSCETVQDLFDLIQSK